MSYKKCKSPHDYWYWKSLDIRNLIIHKVRPHSFAIFLCPPTLPYPCLSAFCLARPSPVRAGKDCDLFLILEALCSFPVPAHSPETGKIFNIEIR